MATGTLGQMTRLEPRPLVNYLQFTINFNDNSVATGAPVPIWLPKGAMIVFTNVFIQTAFNAGTTNALTVGTNASSYNNLIASGDLNPALTGENGLLQRGASLGKLSADSQVFYTYTQSGTAATAGKAYVTVLFVNDNDVNLGT